MSGILTKYYHWLHGQWPAGRVEKLPESGPSGVTAVAGAYIVGDLSGIPLLKFSSEGGVQAVRHILADAGFRRGEEGDETLDVAIIGAGVAGISAAIEAKRAGLRATVFEATETFSTVANFPKGKPIYTYPTEMKTTGGLHFSAQVKEDLLAEMHRQRTEAGIEPVRARIDHVEKRGGFFALIDGEKKTIATARRVIVAIGRSGNFRKLGCPGEDLDKVSNRLFDPSDYAGKNVLVVGGGDSALETAIALASCGAGVTLAYRKAEFSRPKPENAAKLEMLRLDPEAEVSIETPVSDRVTTAVPPSLLRKTRRGRITLALSTEVREVRPDTVTLQPREGKSYDIPNEAVFAMIGREAPLDFFRRSGLPVRGDWKPATWMACIAFVIFCVFLYHFKSNHPAEFPVQKWLAAQKAFPFNMPRLVDGAGGVISHWAKSEGNLLYTIKRGLGNPSFYYTLAYCTCVVVFGIRRIRRRRTPYVTLQTWVLMAMQCLPLFILPEIILPWMGRNGWFETGQPLRWLADQLFETYDGGLGHERAYWRAYGFILAWPLNVYNVFTEHPLWLWLGISFVQTFVLIPLIIWRWGKGAYCGWLCSCGALAETLGDAHRQKMPHGPLWNKVNMIGQAALLFAVIILLLRILGWSGVGWATLWYGKLFEGIPFLNYAWSVDILLGGIIGVGFYFWFSGRVWCRFACPLAAWMHICARFTRFRIFAEKSKCISCNVCTSVCHQGIDIMNFANKGMPMADPECVRCSACVQQCPTGVLAFGHYGEHRKIVLDTLPASPVRMREGRK